MTLARTAVMKACTDHGEISLNSQHYTLCSGKKVVCFSACHLVSGQDLCNFQ